MYVKSGRGHNARDALGALLRGVKDEESLLRDYVMGVGYR